MCNVAGLPAGAGDSYMQLFLWKTDSMALSDLRVSDSAVTGYLEAFQPTS